MVTNPGTVAQNIVDTLAANGVQRVWGVPGDSLNGFTDALRASDIDWMHVRHEEGAAFAAAAEAELTGELAVCAGSCGPGNLHLINGLFDAQRSRVPLLAIAAQIPTEEIGSGYFQETDPKQLFADCAVYVENVSSPSQMPRTLRIAIRAAIERRGVAVIVIPGDVALAEAVDTGVARIARSRPRVVPCEDELRRAVDLLDGASRVTILAGGGVAGAHDDVVALAGQLQAPIVHALRGKQEIEWDNPYDVGMTGLLGFASGYKAMEEAEVLLMLGTDFPYQQFYPSKAAVIQVDLRGEQLGRRHPVDVGIVGDVGETVRALLPRLGDRRGSRGGSRHLDAATRHYRKTRERLDDLAAPSRKGRPIHPQYLTRLLDQKADVDAVFTCDVGSPTVWAARYLTMTRGRNLIGSFVHGSMANALPQAIGAQAAYPGRQVISLSGDGGLTMLLGELFSAVQNRLPVKVVVYNNASLNFVELEMKAAGFVTYATGLDNPDLAAVARAVGFESWHVAESRELPGAIDEFLAHDGPALLDVVCDRQELSIPPAITAAQLKGFTLYAMRTVLSGRGDELVDLAKANLRQIL